MNEFLMLISGFFGIILYIVLVFVVPPRLLKIIENQDVLTKIQVRAAISLGALKSRTCVKCGDIHSPELRTTAGKCPVCGILYAKEKIIVKSGGVIKNCSRQYYEKNKDKKNLELIWEYNKTV